MPDGYYRRHLFHSSFSKKKYGWFHMRSGDSAKVKTLLKTNDRNQHQAQKVVHQPSI
jgi:hypothetical protein